MNEIFVAYSLIYVIIISCFVYKTDLFISIGLTVENLFESYLGREQDNFVIYHIKKSCITTILHLSIPFGFFTGLSIFKIQKYFISILGDFSWQLVFFSSLVLPVYALIVLILQYQRGWHSHPIIKKLKHFENDQFTSWLAVCAEINAEYRQLEKVILHCGNRMKLVLTRNWIIKVSTYDLDFARQDDARLVVYSSDRYNTGNNGYSSVIQFINVKVCFLRETKEFSFRLQSYDFKDLKDALQCPITVSRDVTLYQSKVDEFLEIFKEFVTNNPTYEASSEEPEMCIGCMAIEANVKLMKNCSEVEQNENINGIPSHKCVSCKCRPLWCVDCMGKWFASRQNQTLTETWLSSKCPCPVCRCIFCILDVSLVVRS